MLPKKNRADKKAVERIFKEGRFLNSPNLTFKFLVIPGKKTPARVSVVAPKNIAKLAVKRNFLRRQGYLVLGKHVKDLPPGLIGVLIFKKYQEDIPTIDNETKNIFTKIN